MKKELTKRQLLDNWIEVSERLIIGISEDQLELVPALLDLREKILSQILLAKESGEITKAICHKAGKVEKEVYRTMNSKINEVRQLLQASNRQERINSYEKYEGNDMTSILNFYK